MIIAAARAARWPLAFVALLLAYWAFDYSLASNMRRANPEAAYRARPTDPGAVARAMTDRMVARNQFNASAADANNARVGLRQDPLNRVLLRTLGAYEEVNGKTSAAFAAMQMAHRVSRRDAITELWLAEYYRRQDNFAKALVHYDAAMLVRPDLQKVLFPEMTKALAQEEFRSAVRPYIVRKASWTVPFVGTAALADIDHAVALVEPVANRMVAPEHEPAFAKIIYRLIARGDTQIALAFAPRVFSAFDVKAFVASGFNRATTDPRFGTLAWSFEQAGNLDASLVDGSTISVTVNPLASGKFTGRDIPVTSGTIYQLRHLIDYGQSSAQAQVRWTAACVDERSTPVFWQGAVPVASGRSQYSARIAIPQGCTLMRLTASAVGSDSQVPSEFSISDLQIFVN